MTPLVLVTIVAESVLEDRLVRDLEGVGATGWTLTTARGRSVRGMDPGEFEGGNIRVEVLVPAPLEESVWAVLDREYFGRYSVSAWASDVRVSRPGKFDRPTRL
jgi:hypothetical protein